jgi:hypothetical protein
MSNNQPIRESFDVRVFKGDRQGFQVPGSIKQLMFQRKIAQKCLIERLRLFGKRFRRSRSTADERADYVGKPAATADRRLNSLSPIAAISCIRGEFRSDRLSTGLKYPGLSDLYFRIRQIQKGSQLHEQGRISRCHKIPISAKDDRRETQPTARRLPAITGSLND